MQVPDMTNDSFMLIDSFIDALKAEKGYSVHTCRAYHSDILSFIDFVFKENAVKEGESQTIFLGEVKKFDKNTIRRYLAILVRSGKSKRTISRKLSSLKAFFDYLIKSGHITANPADMIPFPKLGKTIPRFINIDDLFRLLIQLKQKLCLIKEILQCLKPFIPQA